jgi:hypothetical protein
MLCATATAMCAVVVGAAMLFGGAKGLETASTGT